VKLKASHNAAMRQPNTTPQSHGRRLAQRKSSVSCKPAFYRDVPSQAGPFRWSPSRSPKLQSIPPCRRTGIRLAAVVISRSNGFPDPFLV
jgi:hypothetical protein